MSVKRPISPSFFLKKRKEKKVIQRSVARVTQEKDVVIII